MICFRAHDELGTCGTSLVSPKQSVLRIADDHIEQESALF